MTKIGLTPIIDVVFILLIFFMLATNFQTFNKTDIALSKESASVAESEKKIFLIEFDNEGMFKLNDQPLELDQIKSQILTSKKEKEDYMVITKPAENVDVQLILSLIANLKASEINNINLGVTKKKDLDSYQEKKKESVKMPLLEKL